MHRSVRVALVLASAALSSPLAAQDTSPQAGTWGVETGAGTGISVLRFRSTTSAWIFGFSSNYARRELDGDNEITLQNHELRLGWRGYSNPEARTRPIKGISVLVGYEDVTANNSGVRFGGALELGAVHFFSRHVSLGGTIDLTATYTTAEVDPILPGGPENVSIIQARAGLRMLAAVYF
jgi:hypothetical protein